MNPMNPMNSMNHPMQQMSYHPMQQMPFAQPVQQPYVAYSGMPQHNPVAIKSRLYVPNNIVGALIGTKGANIRNMMHMTGAIIHVEGGPEPKKDKEPECAHHSTPLTSTSTSDEKAPTGVTSSDSMTDAIIAVEGGPEPEPEKDKEKGEEKGDDQEQEQEQECASTPVTSTATTSDEKPPTGVDSFDMLHMKDAIIHVEGGPEQEKDKEQEQGSTHSTPVASTFTTSDGKAPTGINSDKNLRPVFLSGYDFQVYRAEFWIFQRIAESMHIFIDELTLTAEVIVPSRIVGRIIGKGGQNIRELQKITHATVKVPEQPKSGNAWQLPIETPVRVIGSFFSLQAVQTRFAALIAESEHREYAA